MKDYKQIEHMRNLNYSLIWERMKRCYDYGYEDGQKEKPQAIYEMRVEEYNKGIDDAWDAAKKIALMDTETSENVTGYFGLFRIMNNLTASEAIAKIKAYEDKQKEEQEDKIKVGDGISSLDGRLGVVTNTNEYGAYIIWDDGTCGLIPRRYIEYGSVKKTGITYDMEGHIGFNIQKGGTNGDQH